MDQVIWIEVLARQRETVTRQRVSGPLVTIGRAYDNDIVLDDPHVAPHHLRLLRGPDGNWSADDLGTLNGMFVNGARRASALLDGQTALQIGQTGIRLRTPACAVPPELPLLRAKPGWPLALACLAALLGCMLLQVWINETGEPKLIAYLTPLLAGPVTVGMWAAVWSVLARIFTGRAQYGRHLFIASAGLLVYTVYEPFTQLGAFALSLPALTGYEFVAMWLILAAVCFAHLRAFGPARLALKAASVLLLAALSIAIQGLGMSDFRSRSNQPTTVLLNKLQPPALRLAPPQTQSDFLTAVTSLKAPLDQARTQELPEGGDDIGD
ncbi:MAG: FHA domain-containing protein [Burkholderiaceae bacterium]|jgi:hypothetical protein|nr:FHA domain-containing protein [Burkholderiaceae bacterium]